MTSLGSPSDKPSPTTPTAADNIGQPQPNSKQRSPFRNLVAKTSPARTPTQPASRLWNPTNSTPRLETSPQSKRQRKGKQNRRRPSTPPPPSIPLHHPALNSAAGAADPVATESIEYPLLTLPQLQQIRLSDTPGGRSSLQASRRASNDNRVSLPPSVRASYDGKRSQEPTPTPTEGSHRSRPDEIALTTLDLEGKAKTTTMASPNQGEAGTAAPVHMSTDLERGPDVMDPRFSTASMGDGIGSAMSSSNSSIMGEDVDPNEEEWGPQHPCFPHMNPHVPLESPEHTSTRIIRIQRDWMMQGDLAPTFSDLYPEILDPCGVSEQEFRRIIAKVNSELIESFNPHGFRNILDGILGVATGWLWDDLGLTAVKSRLNSLETWIENWNKEMEKKNANSEDSTSIPPKLISLRRTGYMTVRIFGGLGKETVGADDGHSWTYRSRTPTLRRLPVRALANLLPRCR